MKPPVIVKAPASPLDAVYTARFRRRYKVALTKEYIDLLTPAELREVLRYVERRIREGGK